MRNEAYAGTDESLGLVAVLLEDEWVVSCGDCQQTVIRTTDKDLADQAERDHRCGEAEAERAFDRLNPTFGVLAESRDPIGHRDLQQREAALALGIRVAVHDSRQNDPNPVVRQAGQDYRAADVTQAARAQPTPGPLGSGAAGRRTLDPHEQGARDHRCGAAV
jgi:hypothetical protein